MPDISSLSGCRNRLLNALSPDDLSLLRPDLQLVKLALRQELEQPNRPVRSVYFIEQGVASVVAEAPSSRIEVGMIGPEGVTGVMVALGDHQSPNATFMQAPGTAWSIEVAALRRALAASNSLHRLLLRFTEIFLIQASQTALANARLTLEGRLARWLLMAQDRLGQNRIPITHDFLSAMLGVRRAGITETVHILQGRQAIRAMRGEIVILERKVLEERAAPIYGLPEAEYERILGSLTPARR